MTLVQFIYKNILLLFVLHTTVKLHTIIMNLPLLICSLLCCCSTLLYLASYQHALCWFGKDEGENLYLKREYMQGRTPFCHRGVIMKMKMSTKGPYEYLTSGHMHRNIQTGFTSLRFNISHMQGQHFARKTRRHHSSHSAAAASTDRHCWPKTEWTMYLNLNQADWFSWMKSQTEYSKGWSFKPTTSHWMYSTCSW